MLGAKLFQLFISIFFSSLVFKFLCYPIQEFLLEPIKVILSRDSDFFRVIPLIQNFYC